MSLIKKKNKIKRKKLCKKYIFLKEEGGEEMHLSFNIFSLKISGFQNLIPRNTPLKIVWPLVAWHHLSLYGDVISLLSMNMLPYYWRVSISETSRERSYGRTISRDAPREKLQRTQTPIGLWRRHIARGMRGPTNRHRYRQWTGSSR